VAESTVDGAGVASGFLERQGQLTVTAEYEILLADATEKDLELLLAWRSHPLVYKGFAIQQKPLTWEEHLHWWRTRRHRQDWIVLVRESGLTRRIGSLCITGLDSECPEVGLYVGEVGLHGRGFGKRILALSVDWLTQKGYRQCQAMILDDNIASQNAFASQGFRLVNREGQGAGRYKREL